ncbi:GGDEF domain-containing protein [Ensifer sp. 1H6]|uniref:GGDEF domain-containing protein n=1 Tax=Ensifer TaxID=106591 RepID=UPI00042E4D93|nr:GGDEF domain-containing protein [Ensifer sp. 1H6]AHK46208.1 two component response regulator [Ensifer adhaerens OV14]MDP9631106.1 diguanylate cyclase (GGDEF)-like protein [Ensifer adhaerens]
MDVIVMSVSPSRAAADAPVKNEVRFSRDQLTLILAALPDPAFILTRSGRYAALFGGADHRYYHDGSSLVGQSVFDVLAHDKALWFALEIEKALGSRALHIVEYSLAGSDVKGLEDAGPDHPIWFEGRVQALDFPVDGEDAVVWVASNITEKNAIEHQLRQQSETDPLTGLYNRRKLLDVLAIEFDLATRTRRPTCLLMFDVDNFKAVNDELGHSVGDELLATIATGCRRALRSDDVLARLGGDEFVVLMPATTLDEGEPIADKLRQQISLELQNRLELFSTISGGLTEMSRRDATIGDILRRADEGLYQSKRNGRNQITVV